MFENSRILVPIDFRACSKNAVRTAIAVAPRGSLTLLHVVDPKVAEARRFSTSELASAAKCSFEHLLHELSTGDWDIRAMTVVGIPSVEILNTVRDLELSLIVLGVEGYYHEPRNAIIGETAERVLKGTPVPVLVVPQFSRERLVHTPYPMELPPPPDVIQFSPDQGFPEDPES